MPHCNTVVNGYGIELCGIASHLFNLTLYYLTYLMQVGMSGHKLRKRVDHGYDRLAKLPALHARCHPQRPGSCHASAFRTHCTSQLMFHINMYFYPYLHLYFPSQTSLKHHSGGLPCPAGTHILPYYIPLQR